MITSSVIDINSWAMEFQVLFYWGWVVLILLNYGFRTYIYRLLLDNMIQAFSKSPYISNASRLLNNQGAIARRPLIDFITGAIKHAPKMIMLNYVSAQDINETPPRARIILSLQYIATRTSTIWALCVMAAILIDEKINSGQRDVQFNEINTWYSTVVFFMITAFITLMTIAFAHTAHITRNHFNEILCAIENSTELYASTKSLALGGFSRKMMATNRLYNKLSSPSLLASGDLSLKDIENFPPHLFRLLARDSLLHKIALILFLSMIPLIPLKPQ